MLTYVFGFGLVLVLGSGSVLGLVSVLALVGSVLEETYPQQSLLVWSGLG